MDRNRSFRACFENSSAILMEGALGERLKREYGLSFDPHIDMGGMATSPVARQAFETLWTQYADIAWQHHLPFICTTPTRRTDRERIASTRYDEALIRQNVEFLRQVQSRQRAEMYVGGMLGFHGDAYTGQGALSLEEAREFHTWEAKLFAGAGVDFFYAALMPDLQEAAGIALALAPYDIPYIISFTIRRDGCLVDGHTIAESIAFIDRITEQVYGAQPERKPLCYMTNCVHPDIVSEALQQPFNRIPAVRERFLGIQANTSALDYSVLDDSVDLKTSDPDELADAMVRLNKIHPFRIWGGCCGTDGRHMQAIAERLAGCGIDICPDRRRNLSDSCHP